ncbi:MAG: GvpL/GvpF family gas vesicle protein [Gallionella sp.]
MQKFIYAVIENTPKNQSIATMMGIGDAPLEAVNYLDLIAVVSDVDTARFAGEGEQLHLPADLLKYQQVNAALLAQGAVLPLKFGLTAADAPAVMAVLKRTYLQLRAQLARLTSKVELVVQATWDIPQRIAVIAQAHPEWIDADPVQTGKRLFEAIEAEKKTYQAAIHQSLAKLAQDFSDASHKSDNMMFNRSYLVERSQEAAFDAAMNDLGEAFDARLTFRYIGPLPVYSFVNIALNQGNFALLEQARLSLSVPEKTTFGQIKSAYRAALLANHPDHHPNDPDAAQRCKTIVAASEVLTAYCQSFPDFAARGNTGEYDFSQAAVEQVFILDTKSALLARGN